MLTVEGIYRSGHVELLEEVTQSDDAKVLVTFVEAKDVDLSTLGIDKAAAAELRHAFESFEDWNDPAMDIYNNYDENARLLGKQ